MITVVLLGGGNVSYHLSETFLKSDEINLIQIYNRSFASLDKFPKDIAKTDCLTELKEADLYVIAVSDDAITELSNKLTFKNRLVVHTSGSTSIKKLNDQNRKGVLYPLQTFSKEKNVDFSSIPICLEAEHKEDLLMLKKLANSISNDVQEINSKQRKALHLAAVFVCNFVNHLYAIGHEICTEHELSFDILKPLILETSEKIVSLSPHNAQTGPAKRDDQKTMKKHRKSITNKTHKELYTLLSKSIRKN
ncbi:MAG: DUF2520 domain-containing protein, partial [Flavobacteriaceae bacterium]|nr:DUF2520 domain-containing protein [Flavobacteriaceae bacterium]